MGEGVTTGFRLGGGWGVCACFAAALAVVACSGSKGEDPAAAPSDVVSAPPEGPGPGP